MSNDTSKLVANYLGTLNGAEKHLLLERILNRVEKAGGTDGLRRTADTLSQGEVEDEAADLLLAVADEIDNPPQLY